MQVVYWIWTRSLQYEKEYYIYILGFDCGIRFNTKVRKGIAVFTTHNNANSLCKI